MSKEIILIGLAKTTLKVVGYDSNMFWRGLKGKQDCLDHLEVMQQYLIDDDAEGFCFYVQNSLGGEYGESFSEILDMIFENLGLNSRDLNSWGEIEKILAQI